MNQEEQRLWKEITGFGRGIEDDFILGIYQEYRFWIEIIGRVMLNMMLCYGSMRNKNFISFTIREGPQDVQRGLLETSE